MSNPAEFEHQVQGCCEELASQLPRISSRHSPIALLTALVEHVGGSLRISMESGSCTPEEARALLARCERTAFNPTARP